MRIARDDVFSLAKVTGHPASASRAERERKTWGERFNLMQTARSRRKCFFSSSRPLPTVFFLRLHDPPQHARMEDGVDAPEAITWKSFSSKARLGSGKATRRKKGGREEERVTKR